MSVRNAFEFIQYLRGKPALVDDLYSNPDQITLEQMTVLGGQQGYTFSVEELRQAHHLDWNMRARYFSHQDQ